MKDNWQPFQLPDGSYSDPTRPWSHQDLVNYLPMQAEMAGSRSGHLLRTAPGLKLIATLGAGPIRGIRDVEGTRFIVSGTTLYRLNADGTNDELGTIPGTGLVSMTHNQVAGGNQLLVGNGPSAYIYDTRDDSLRNPTQPVDPDQEPEPAPGGGSPSTDLGPNGGYPDDNEPAIPLPTVFGTNLIPGGDFADPGDLDDWDNPDGTALTGWTIVSGAAHYAGTGESKALYFPARYRMSPHPFPRYTVTVTGDLKCSAGATVAIGMMTGYSSANDLPLVLNTSPPTEYLVSTPVSYTFAYKVEDAQVSVKNQWVIPNATPVMYVYDDSGAPVTADFDNLTVEIAEVATPVTTQTLNNLDFASGLTGWTIYPRGAGTLTPTVSGGALILDTTTANAKYCWVANDDPIDLADEINKYMHFTAEAWCNDPSLENGATFAGVALGLVNRSPEGVYTWPANIGAYERGDWTAREAWKRQVLQTSDIAAGWTTHLAVGLRCKAGYAVKVRNLGVEVTDSAVTT